VIRVCPLWYTISAGTHSSADGRGPPERGIARQIWIAEATVENHVHSILGQLNLPDSTDDHRRVLAVLAYLSSAGGN
jgi:DNA-binding NarL/FixJ family response regulator